MKSYHIKLVYVSSLIAGVVFFMLSMITAQRWTLEYKEQLTYYNPAITISPEGDAKIVYAFLTIAFFILSASLLFIGRQLSKSIKNQL